MDSPRERSGTAEELAAKSGLRQLVILSGPPCSGKSALAGRLKVAYPAVSIHGMDEVRLKELPLSIHSKQDRVLAYGIMHREASDAFASGARTVVLDATYGPIGHRKDAAKIASDWNADLFVVECRVDPDEAVFRYRGRTGDHAGVDMNEARVRRLAMNYPYSGAGLILDTSAHSRALAKLGITAGDINAFGDYLCSRVVELIALGEPVKVADLWTTEPQSTAQTDWAPPETTEFKHSPWSRRTAIRVMIYHGLVVAGALGLAVLGLALLVRAAVISTSPDPYSVATAWISAGILAAALFAVAEFLARPSLRNAREVARAVRTVTFGEPEDVARPDPEIREAYVRRVEPRKERPFPIVDRPIYFVIPPSERRFEVVVDPSQRLDWSPVQLARRALEAGFDWGSFDRWRRHDKGREYYGSTRRWEPVARVCGLTSPAGPSAPWMLMTGRAHYGDYLVAEQSVDIQISGQLPYVRELVEGQKLRD